MSDKAEGQERPAKRGEAAWKELVEGVAASNQRVRKASKAQREAFDRQRAELRRASVRRRQEQLARRQTP